MKGKEMIQKTLIVNGIERKLIVDANAKLSDVLREQLHLLGVKVGCASGQCGACSVLIDGKVKRACITKMRTIDDYAAINTIEGLGTKENLHPLQTSWVVNGGAQCGFCTPGFIMSAKGLLDENPDPSREEVRDWFQKHKNVCRCTGYVPLVDAVMDAAKACAGKKLCAWSKTFRLTAACGDRATRAPQVWPKSLASGISATIRNTISLREPCIWPWFTPRSPMPTSRVSIIRKL